MFMTETAVTVVLFMYSILNKTLYTYQRRRRRQEDLHYMFHIFLSPFVSLYAILPISEKKSTFPIPRKHSKHSNPA